jgi:hypothetical protein
MQGDNRIREVKTQIREIFEEDHEIESSGNGDNWGFHKKVTLMEVSDFPTTTDEYGFVFTKETDSVSELYYLDDKSNSQQLTDGNNFIGGMMNEMRMWSGLLANIPAGWMLCDQVNLPDMRGKFFKHSATGTDIGVISGADTITLTTSTMPSHIHSLGTTGSAHNHAAPIASVYVGTDQGSTTLYLGNYAGGETYGSQPRDGRHTHTLAAYGAGTAFNNQPAFVQLAYIRRR